MILALKIVIAIFLVFTAIGLLCAVRIGRRRPPPVDPFFYPFGEMPAVARLPARSTRRPHYRPDYGGHCILCGAATTAEFAADCIDHPFYRTPGGAAIPPAAGSGKSSVLSGDAAARAPFLRRRARAR